jgi:hypothetical protein
LEVVILMIRPAFALAMLFVGAFPLSTPAFAKEKLGSRAPVVLPPASEVEKDAADAAEAIEARQHMDHRILEDEGAPSLRPDLDPAITQGIQSRGLQDIRR